MKKILVVDDNEMLARLACDILHTEGYRAVPATNVQEALEAFEREEFDLLVTDLGMPGMSGVELARAVQQKQPGFPVIVITAYGPVECEHVKLWLPKEYLFPNLLEKIRSCLAEAEAEKVGK
ncbi:MAG: response regulator [Acidobacteriia bacterium]|nr:response regulator [Terriglobia bacterium]